MDPEETEARRTLMEMDSPEHTRLRRLVSRPFAPKSVNEYEDAIRQLAVEVLDSLEGEREFNFVQRVAPSRRRPHWKQRPRLHGVRRRSSRHVGVPTTPLSLPRRPRTLRVRHPCARRASHHAHARHLERVVRAHG